MFKKSTIRALSIVAIILSAFGLLLSIAAVLVLKQSATMFAFVMGIITWSFLLWSSIIGYQLGNYYNLYEEEYRKVGYRLIAIIIAFGLFFFVGLVAGLIISVTIFSTLWGLKRNYDEWDSGDSEGMSGT